MRVFRWYGQLAKRRPFLTQIGTAGVLTTTGDVIAQYAEGCKKYNFKRTLVMSTCGFFYFGPVVSVWLRTLKHLNLHFSLAVALDQSFAAPLILGGFTLLHPVLSQKSWKEAKAIFFSSYVNILKTNWMVWIPAQTVNFSLVPHEYRMLFIQLVAVGWNTFLSCRANNSLKEQDGNATLQED